MKHTQYAFTLVELLVAVVISGVVLAGAFSLQFVFHRAMNEEESIADMQANLDGIRFFFQKAMRQLGSGVGTTTSYYNCNGSVETVPTLGVHNNNSLPVVPDITEGGVDTDPDWLEYTVASSVAMTYVDGQFSKSWADVQSTTGFYHRNVLAITINGKSCMMRLTNIVNNVHGGRLHFAPAPGGLYCMNHVITMEQCGVTSNGSTTPTSPIPVVNLGEFPFQALRVDTSRPNSPMLMHGVKKLQNNQSTYTWVPLALDVEDLQLAVHVDTSNPPDERGDVWVNSRDTLASEVGRWRALRVSVVVRTPTPSSPVATTRPALEDRPAGTPDRYKRRVLRFIAKIPNRPTQGGSI